ncbi:MAG: DUF5069 domain-containing protein [Nitrospinae bacterium]|nr:DUF5069 domain-containing protein [Nitrospinota bacterium]MCH7650653.1 DUF5069 domain-containing protein [Nitrospinota bacterium]
MNKEKLQPLAKDLTKGPPRSPREVLGGYVILARCLDKCRAFLLGMNGEYNYWYCSLCSQLEEFTGVDHEDMKEFVATGVTDEELAEWFKAQSKIKNPLEIIRWNNKMRDMRLSEMSDEAQEFLAEYIRETLPPYPPVYVWFDVYDVEEGRL